MANPKSDYRKYALIYVVGFLIVIAMAYAIYLIGPEYNTSTTSSSTTIQTTASTTIGGFAACPNIYYSLNGSITGYSGFTEYNLKYNNGTIIDYVIANGSSGKLNITEFVSRELSGYPNQTRTHTIFIEGMGPGTNNTVAQGISVAARPANFTVTNNTYANFTATITVNQSAPNRTYWIYIDECGARISPVLITIGSSPYSGNIIASGNTYM